MNEMFWGSSKVVSKSKPDAGVRNKFVDGDAYEVVSFEAKLESFYSWWNLILFAIFTSAYSFWLGCTVGQSCKLATKFNFWY